MAAQNISINDSDIFVYSRETEYSHEDTLMAIQLEQQEQKRRIADEEGENHKRVLAQQLSELFNENLRATWFQRGSSFVLSLLGSVRTAVVHTAGDVSHKAQDAAFNFTNVVSEKAGDFGVKAADGITKKAELLGQQAQTTAHNVTDVISNKANEVGLLAQQKAQDVSQTVASSVTAKASEVGLQAQSAALNIKEKGLESAHNASVLAQEKALDLKAKGFSAVQGATSLISGKVFEYTDKLKDAVTSMSLYKRLSTLGHNSNLTFALMETETERAYRMNSSNEIFAIQNALKVSAMIKALSPELYRPDSEPHLHYGTRLLEEAERSRRISAIKSDKAAIDNAKAVSGLINQKFTIAALPQQLKSQDKVEILDSNSTQKSFVAAM